MEFIRKKSGHFQALRKRAEKPGGDGSGTALRRRRAREIKKLEFYKNIEIKKAERAQI